MSTKPRQNTPRQFAVTISEAPGSGRIDVTLRWRTFPCRADEWHGRRTVTLAGWKGGGKVSDEQDFRDLLLVLADHPWKTPRR
jgi:hypothetical protein